VRCPVDLDRGPTHEAHSNAVVIQPIRLLRYRFLADRILTPQISRFDCPRLDKYFGRSLNLLLLPILHYMYLPYCRTPISSGMRSHIWQDETQHFIYNARDFQLCNILFREQEITGS